MRTILITGANGNLGNAVVENLHQKGFDICVTVGPGNLEDSFKAKTKDFREINLTDEVAVDVYIKDLTQKHPTLNAAVLLVGGFAMGDFKMTDGAAIDQQIALNFKTAFFTVKPLMEHFQNKNGGQFILVGARPALNALAGKDMIAYALSKSLVFELANLINAEGKGKGITATVIVPSVIDTAANRKSMPNADVSKWVKVEDIAESIAFVLSDSGSILRETILKVYNEA